MKYYTINHDEYEFVQTLSQYEFWQMFWMLADELGIDYDADTRNYIQDDYYWAVKIEDDLRYQFSLPLYRDEVRFAIDMWIELTKERIADAQM